MVHFLAILFHPSGFLGPLPLLFFVFCLVPLFVFLVLLLVVLPLLLFDLLLDLPLLPQHLLEHCANGLGARL